MSTSLVMFILVDFIIVSNYITGVALSDSPAGFLAYLLQVVSIVTRKNNDEKEDGGLLDHYTQDQLIDTLMVYWAPNKITTSSRIYAESFNKKSFEMRMDE